MKYDGLIFDIDGTLWDSRMAVTDSWNEALKAHTELPATLDYVEVGKQFGKPMEDIFSHFFPEVTGEKAKQLAALLYEAENTYLEAHPPKAYDGVKETLAELSKRYKLFIVTNAQKGYVECLYRGTGIGAYFTDHLCYGDTLKSKDFTMQRLIERNGLRRPVYIGDTQGDYDACRKIGVPMIYAAYGLGKVNAELPSVRNIRELLTIL